MFRFFFALICVFSIAACSPEKNEYQHAASNPIIYHDAVKALTDVIVHDIFSPPVASRIYAYSTIGGYEGARFMDSTYVSLAGQIKHFSEGPKPKNNEVLCYPMVATMAFLKIGKTLIFSEDKLQKQIDSTSAFYRNTGMPKRVFNNSMNFAEEIAAHIIEWSSKDNYKQSRSFPKFNIQNDPAIWKPTPPAYMEAIEPSWNKIRTFLLDSASQFRPDPPSAFNVKDQKSSFYQDMMETYLTVKNATDEQIEIANFWDCNPYKMNVTGHVMHATKKITPGGHWINITSKVGRDIKANFVKSAESYALVSLGLADAFISCWDEKYRSNYIRPETVINEYIDKDWMPILQTPPFPEYTSGHSVASAAASEILTKIYGDSLAFEDDTEVEFGLPIRMFNSFYHAAEEAAISRLYGGIHFKPAIENGLSQGKQIGQLVASRLRTQDED